MKLYMHKIGEILKTLYKSELAHVIYPGEDEVKELEFESAQPDMIFSPKNRQPEGKSKIRKWLEFKLSS